MKREKTFEELLLTLKTVGTREEQQFRRAMEALRSVDDWEATVDGAMEAVERLCADPLLFSASRARVPGRGAAALMEALRYRSIGGDARYAFEGAASAVALRRLALARTAMAAFRTDEVARRAAARFSGLAPEPPVGAAGTTTLRVVPANEKRRFEADDTFLKVLPWLRVLASNPALGAEGASVVHPPKDLARGDDAKTLQALGLWPSATLSLEPPAAALPPPPPPRRPASLPAGKPKPSDLFKRVKRRFDGAKEAAPRRTDAEKRALAAEARLAAQAPAPAAA